MSPRPVIAWVGNGYFDQQFQERGFDVRRIRFFKPRVLDWDMVCAEAGAVPDMVLYADASLPPPLAGVEGFPCLTLFYCVDSHIHQWYAQYARGFDLCAVSLRDHVEDMGRGRQKGRVFWLPPFPIRGERPPESPPERDWDVLFVGRVDPETTPLRQRFLEEFSALVPGTEVRQGAFGKLFPRARIVLNIAERGDLNFRVFEALATGGCLLTPRIGNGQEELFRDGVHLFTYEHNDPVDAARKAVHLLEHPELCQAARLAGAAEIDARHRIHHRVETILERLHSLDWQGVVRERLARADELRRRYLKLIYLHWASVVHEEELSRRYLRAARGAAASVEGG